jgi:D-tyrosyl-tRNA(Tyr) deacylase
MRAVVQRVVSASVVVDGAMVGSCGRGLLLLVGVHREDSRLNAEKLAAKIAHLRIFNDEAGKMNLSLLEVGGSVLAVSNFTVYGDASKSRRPSFTESAPFEVGRELFEEFVELLRGQGLGVETGVFGADMQVSLVNDGPVTVVVDA